MERTVGRIGELVKGKKNEENVNSIIYKVPCGGCPRAYIGETYRGLKTRMSEHKRDMKNQKKTSSFVIHAEEQQHLPKFGAAEVIWQGDGKGRRKLMESAAIGALANINSKRGDYILAPMLAAIMWEGVKKT